MPEHVESVNKIRSFFEEQSKTAAPQWKAQFEGFKAALDGVHDELVHLYGLTTALPPDLGNVHDLPPELLGELSITKGDELDDQIVTVINAYGGEASLDQILVGLFRKFKVNQKRRFMQNKMYRMSMVWSVDGRKGVYTTTEPDDLPKEPEDHEKKGFFIDLVIPDTPEEFQEGDIDDNIRF